MLAAMVVVEVVVAGWVVKKRTKCRTLRVSRPTRSRWEGIE